MADEDDTMEFEEPSDEELRTLETEGQADAGAGRRPSKALLAAGMVTAAVAGTAAYRRRRAARANPPS